MRNLKKERRPFKRSVNQLKAARGSTDSTTASVQIIFLIITSSRRHRRRRRSRSLLHYFLAVEFYILSLSIRVKCVWVV